MTYDKSDMERILSKYQPADYYRERRTLELLVLNVLAIMTLALVWRYGWTVQCLIYSILSMFMIFLSIVNIRTFRLPNKLTISGSIVAILLTIFLQSDQLLPNLGQGYWAYLFCLSLDSRKI